MAHPDIEYKLMLERRRNDLAAAEYSRLVKIALDAQKENRSARNSFHPGILIPVHPSPGRAGINPGRDAHPGLGMPAPGAVCHWGTIERAV